jgi:hypothetical protein
MNNETHCPCGAAFADRATSFLPGYARRAVDDVKVCYDCATAGELAAMHESGRATLYLNDFNRRPDGNNVSNWIGGFRFPVASMSYGRHNITGFRVDVWFRDDRGKVWHGTQYGKDTQLVHCRRSKERR